MQVRETFSPAFRVLSRATALPCTGAVFSSPLTFTVIVLAAKSAETTSPSTVWGLSAGALAGADVLAVDLEAGLEADLVSAACAATPATKTRAMGKRNFFICDFSPCFRCATTCDHAERIWSNAGASRPPRRSCAQDLLHKRVATTRQWAKRMRAAPYSA